MEQKETGNNGIEEIKLVSLPEALRDMKIGETKYAPSDCTDASVRVKCSELKSEGYVFRTVMHEGRRLITRIG